MKIYRCNICNNILVTINDSGVVPYCCNSEMEVLVPQDIESLNEKHIPIISIDGCKVTIEVNHVMEEKHYIQTIILETNKGYYIKNLRPSELPIASFKLCKEEMPINAYEYCNIHGLFKKEFEDETKQGC